MKSIKLIWSTILQVKVDIFHFNHALSDSTLHIAMLYVIETKGALVQKSKKYKDVGLIAKAL